LYITQFHNQINIFITLIDGGNFDNCGGDIDGGDLTSSSFTTENLQLDEGYFPAHA
jgi:hypothetical protein